jgi:asparagine synthase (glutamine-hydrolysing)
MFAIAIYDTVNQKLTLIRDRMGIKPLYYFWDGKNLAFASELKALLKLQFIQNQKSINYSALNEFLLLGYTGIHESIYNNIYKLPAGSYLEIDANSFNISPFWEIKNKIQKETITDYYQAKETLHDLVEASVRYRLKSDVPYGTFLSGGIDSSLVTAVAQRNLTSRLKTFTIGFADSKYNESNHAKKVADFLGTDHTELLVTEQDAIRLTHSILDIYDEPFADSSAIPTMLVSQLARTQVTMTLSGDGGDELFMGYGAYTWAKRLENPFLATFRKPIAAGMSLGNDWFKRGAKVLNYNNSENIPSHIFSQEQGFFTRNEISKLLSKDFVKPINLIEYPKSLARNFSATENQAFFDMNYYLKEDLLTKVDRASMQFSLESRVPLLDYNIVEFALNVDESLKIKDNTQKYLLKQVLYDYVPAEMFQRPKWGFSIPLKTWLKTDLRFLITDYLNPTLIAKHGIFNQNMVQSIIDKFLQHEQDHLYTRVWAMILVQRFFEETYPKS